MKELQTLRTQYRVGDFVTWMREGTLELNPNFQRRPVWKKGAKSFLIDTIVRGLPIPIIFLRDLRSDLKSLKASRDVVDGQQRIRTIFSFIDSSLLKNANPPYDPGRDEFRIIKSHNKELADMSFDDLPKEYKQRILDYQFSVHSFPADTDDREILQIFARMNATGVKLNAQELRNAEFYGEFKTKAYELAAEQLNRWRDWRVFSPDQIARMNEVELTSEFMLLIMRGISQRNNKSLSFIYEEFDEDFPEETEVAARFQKTFGTIESMYTKEELSVLFSRRPIFYALFAAVYDKQFGLYKGTGEPPKIKAVKGATISPKIASIIRSAGERIRNGKAPRKVLKALRGATGNAQERRILTEYLLTGK
jgi:hypothetical protein